VLRLKREEVYDTVVEAFDSKFSWLGGQFATEFLESIASWNIQQFSKPEYRIRKHIALYWEAAWLKSSLLKRAYDILGDQLCMVTSDITVASLRGTVEFGKFVPPYTLVRPFAVATEFGQVVGPGKEDMVQKLLNVLEEGMVTVSLSKISSLSAEQVEMIQNEYPMIRFIEKNTFSYNTNWVLMAATYNKKFMIDNAFESRFNLVIPEKPLDSNLTKYVKNSPRFHIEEDVLINLREFVLDGDHKIDCNVNLPDELFEESRGKITPRQCAMLSSYVLTNEWWGKKVTNDDIMVKAEKMKTDADMIWKTTADKIFELIIDKDCTLDEIRAALKSQVTDRAIYYALNKLRPVKMIKPGPDGKDHVYYKIM
jgi:hypothetical protein